MTKHDYEKLGFRAGLEIHQQLDTKKLFCDCPSVVHDKNPDVHLKRKLHAVAGETGEVDAAAMHETMKDIEINYEACDTSSCLVELDEEPPHHMNDEALQIVIQVAKMLNAEIVEEIQIMRKTVIDGSNPSGFQRTSLVAMNGYIGTLQGRIGIPTICIEEEAAKKVSKDKDSITYRLDRLGVPLIEIATDPGIKDPEHAKEVAEKLGMILRSTKKVKRGIGSIRQDVNVSIKAGARTEIKGFQDLKSIPKVIEKEIERQLKLINQGKKIKQEVRKAETDFSTSFLRPMPGSARMYPETDCKPVVTAAISVEKFELIDDKIKDLEKRYNLNKDFAAIIAKKHIDFEKYAEKYRNIKPLFIAETILSTPKEIKRRYNVEVDVFKYADEVLERLDKGEISKEAVIEILAELGKGKKVDYSKYALMSDADIEKELKKVVAENKGAPFNALIGKAMAKLRGKADGKKIVGMLKRGV